MRRHILFLGITSCIRLDFGRIDRLRHFFCHILKQLSVQFALFSALLRKRCGRLCPACILTVMHPAINAYIVSIITFIGIPCPICLHNALHKRPQVLFAYASDICRVNTACACSARAVWSSFIVRCRRTV